MTSKLRRGLAAAAAAAVLLLVAAAPANAHESRSSGGYTAVVGWAVEPAYTGFPNAVQIRLSDSAGEPVVDLGAEELQVEVQFGNERIGPLPVEPAFSVGAFGDPGDYQTDLIPTRPGTYTFHFTGTIKGEPFDQTFTSGEDTFAEPQNPAEVSFPAQDPTNGELAESIEQLRAQGEGSDDNDQRTSPTALAGIGLGAVALLVALGALMKARSA